MKTPEIVAIGDSQTRARDGLFTRIRWASRTFFPFLAFFVTLLFLSLPKGLSSLAAWVSIPVTTRSAEAAEAFGFSDAGSLLKAAMSLRESGTITPEWQWVYNLWPPGMVIVDRVMLELEALINVPIVLLMVVLGCLVWAALFGTWFAMVRSRWGSIPAVVFGIGAVLYSGISVWGVKNGLFYADSFGTAAFCLSILLLVKVSQAQTSKQRVVLASLAGVALATACYFRASFEIVAGGTLLLASVMLVVALIARASHRLPVFAPGAIGAMLPLAVMGIAAQIVMLPWRLYSAITNHPGDFRWSTVSDLASPARWLPESILRDAGMQFAIDGRSNWACTNDPVQCNTIFRLENTTESPYSGGYFTPREFDAMALQAFFAHPFRFIAERLDALWIGLSATTGTSVTQQALPESLLLVGLFVAIVAVIIRTRLFNNPGILYFLIASAGQIATLTMMHMESRYFLALELSTIMVAALVLPRAFRQTNPDLKLIAPDPIDRKRSLPRKTDERSKQHDSESIRGGSRL